MKTNTSIAKRLCRVAKLVEYTAAEARPNLIFHSEPSEFGEAIARELQEAAENLAFSLRDAIGVLDAEGGGL